PPTPFTATATAATILCFGADTTVIVTGSGASPTYTTIIFSAQTAGIKTYTVFNGNGCSAVTAPINIGQPTQLVASASAPSIACFGGTTTVSFVVNGGTTPYTGNGTVSATAGLKTYTISDVNGCTTTATVNINQPTPFTATATPGTISCFGGATTVSIPGSGGSPAYTGTVLVGQSAATAKTYTVFNGNGCSAVTAPINIGQPTQLVASASAPSIACFGGTTTVSFVVNGGTTPYTGNGTVSATAGLKTYTISDANGCTTTATVNINQPTPFTATATAGTILCFG